MRRAFAAALILAISVWVVPSGAARADTLADLRAEIESLGADLGRLRSELVRSDSATPRIEGDTLERVDRIESALARLTSQAEELDFRIRRIVTDATNRLGDIEFRLVELEGGDVSQLSATAPLGGLDTSLPASPAPAAPSDTAQPADNAPFMAEGEQRAFEAAAALLNEGRTDEAAIALAEFIEGYPGGPRTEEAQLLLGAAHQARGATGDAARAFLNLFTANPQGPRAPAALLALGESLADLGETAEACVMFEELSIRFPDTQEEARGREFLARLNCG